LVELQDGRSRVRNQVQWARLYLVHSGLVDASKRGVWSLTEKGLAVETQTLDVHRLYRDIQKQLQARRKQEHPRDEETAEADTELAAGGYRARLLEIIKELPPAGFERLCQRLLRESGFQQVVVTGRSGDGGIDGMGSLKVTPFVSFNVLFQCKRYEGAVSASHIRDFRGAMMGRADKGIMITTGTFTVDARKEARRDGVPPLELVAGEDLVQLFESLELGLKPRKTYDVDDAFFDEFRK
jgi:restriction system protein